MEDSSNPSRSCKLGTPTKCSSSMTFDHANPFTKLLQDINDQSTIEKSVLVLDPVPWFLLQWKTAHIQFRFWFRFPFPGSLVPWFWFLGSGSLVHRFPGSDSPVPGFRFWFPGSWFPGSGSSFPVPVPWFLLQWKTAPILAGVAN